MTDKCPGCGLEVGDYVEYRWIDSQEAERVLAGTVLSIIAGEAGTSITYMRTKSNARFSPVGGVGFMACACRCHPHTNVVVRKKNPQLELFVWEEGRGV